MSLRVDLEDRIKWADDDSSSDLLDRQPEDASSISSEEESRSEWDTKHRNRYKPQYSQIWQPELVCLQMTSLPDSEQIKELLDRGDLDVLKYNSKSVLLMAAWFGRASILKSLIENRVDLEVTDQEGRTPVYLSALAGNSECLRVLLEAGAKVNVYDVRRKANPLHCAAVMGSLECVKLLVEFGADVNDSVKSMTALHYAVQSRSVECIRVLLEHGANPNTTQIFSETPLHIAAALGIPETLHLLITHGAAVNVQSGAEKLTPLHLTSEDGDPVCTRILLQHQASVTSLNHKHQTPLHLAALSQCPETVSLLLSHGSNPNSQDLDGRTPLHSSIVKVTRNLESIKLLLQHGSDVNKPDHFGYTPMHLAALNEFSQCVLLLLNHGGDVTLRTNGGISVLSFITRKTPDVIPKYIQKFDNSIKLNDHEIGDVDCELKLDFRVLVPAMGRKETELLLNFIEVGHREVLKHPLVETFLFLKWNKRICKFFLFSLFYHSLFVFLFSTYVIKVYLAKVEDTMTIWMRVIGMVLLGLNAVMLGKECFQIAHAWLSYIKQWENWLQWSIIICVFCCVQPLSSQKVSVWQHHVAAIAIFLTWVELMMIVGRFPIFGIYIQMFTTVSLNFAKFITAYFCLFLAFGLSFGVIFTDFKTYQDLKWVLIKIIVMMSGELEYDDTFADPNTPITYNGTAQIMFLAFVILVTVILTNLLVGLAVSDIQGLQQSAGLDRLVRQAELVAHLESMLFSKLLSCLPGNLMKFLQKQALLLKSQYHWALYVRPNDPREERIPRELIQSIYRLVAERKEKPRRRTNRSVLSRAANSLSRLNSCNSWMEPNSKKQIEELSTEFQIFAKQFLHKLEEVKKSQNIK